MKGLAGLMLAGGIFFLLGAVWGNEAGGQEMGKGESRIVPAGDIRIAYKTMGQGEPLVLIMGYSGTMDLWSPEVLRELAARRQVIVFDNRGMGKTTAGDREFSIQLFADDTVRLLDALNIKRAHVLGWSMGSAVALELALAYPERVGKLVLYAANCGGKEAIPPDPMTLKTLTDTSGTTREIGERLLKTLFPPNWMKEHPDPRTYFPTVEETISAENVGRQAQAVARWKGVFERLEKITQPTLLITGAEDRITPAGNSLTLAQKIPGAWVVQLKGSGHGAMYQDPRNFSKILLTFLETSGRKD
jgi:pimeloyl-ACP methyl ester carboxylesterase